MSDLEKLTAERDALAAQVETLKQHTSLVLLEQARKEKNEALAAFFAYKEFLMHINDCLSKNGEYAPLSRVEIVNLITATPQQQHLAEVKAQAVESALDAVGVPCTKFKNHSADFTAGFNFCGAQVQLYADSIRQGEVK